MVIAKLFKASLIVIICIILSTKKSTFRMTFLNRQDDMDRQVSNLKEYLAENAAKTTVSKKELQTIKEDNQMIAELRLQMKQLKESNVYGKGSHLFSSAGR